MTRAHFTFIAETLRDAKPNRHHYGDEALYRGSYLVWRLMVMDFSDRLSETNSGFNPSRFVKACGIEE